MQSPNAVITHIHPDLCQWAPFAVHVTMSEAQNLLMADQMAVRNDCLTPFFGIESGGFCQIFVGGYQLEAFQQAFPSKPLPVHVGTPKAFRPQDIVGLMLDNNTSPVRTTPEGSHTARAEAITNLKQWFDLTDSEIAQHANMHRSTVTQTRKLLSLHSRVKRELDQGRISFSIARELQGIEYSQQKETVEKIVKNSMNISAVRAMLIRERGGKTRHSLQKDASVGNMRSIEPQRKDAYQPYLPTTPDIQRIEQMINEHIGFPVAIKMLDGERGLLTIKPHDHRSLGTIGDLLSKDTLKSSVSINIGFEDSAGFDRVTEGMVPKEEEY